MTKRPRDRTRLATETLRPKDAATAGDSHAPVIDDVEDLLVAASDERDTVWLWRQGGARWDYLEPLSPLTLRELGVRETVRQRYGGGAFRARLRERGGKWGVSREFSIEGAPKSPPRDDAAPAATAPSSSSSSSQFFPPWLGQVLLPIATALGAGMVKRLLETPQPDPLLVKLLERIGRGGGESLNALELQKLVLDAERRGEERGRELGELGAAVDDRRGGGGDGSSSSGVTGAIQQAVPVINRMLDMAQRSSAGRRRVALPALPASEPTTGDSPTVPDIVPRWLRPFIQYKPQLLDVADRGKQAVSYAGMIMDTAEDNEQLLTAIVEANTAGRLLEDLRAAIPELAGNPAREKFAAELVTELQALLDEITEDEPSAPATEGTNG